ncbi:MAG TPA: class I SAM-dependent methyltransferase [Pseudonocardiaceae bacterium]|jgi:O-methyltransferase involved in polyketide biosynthesis|nr:class I SAM-dependent methyltransferase [Pseudonocardiaceae bacterium]
MSGIELTGVPATMLLTLYYRASEAARPDTVLSDPRAVRVLEEADFPFRERLGPPRNAQFVALRCKCFDAAVTEFLAAHPEGTVVSLGEGLETQFWRVDNGRARWLTVDLPESMAVREKVLPVESGRQRQLACSALDFTWCDAVDASRGVLIVVQGVLPYLRPPEVRTLLSTCAQRFPGGSIVFDTVSRRMGEMARRNWNRKHDLPMPEFHWTVEATDQQRLATADPNIVEVRDRPMPAGRGLLGRWLMPALGLLSPGGRAAMVTQLYFGRG